MSAKPTAREQIAKCSAQTQEYIKALAALIRSSTDRARDKYIALAAERGWKLAEAQYR